MNVWYFHLVLLHGSVYGRMCCPFICIITEKSYGQILMTFSENVHNVIRDRYFNFGVDLDHSLDPGIL